jgi:transcriptional regulator with XRE-family HTH domain
MTETFGEWLRANMDARGISIGNLAGRIGLSDVALGKILNGKTRRPEYETVIAIAKDFGYDGRKVLVKAGYPDPGPSNSLHPEWREILDDWDLMPEEDRADLLAIAKQAHAMKRRSLSVLSKSSRAVPEPPKDGPQSTVPPGAPPTVTSS